MRHFIFSILILSNLIACDRAEIRKEFYADGTLKSESLFKNDLKNGQQLNYDSSGILTVRQFFRNDTLDGQKTTYYENGNIAEIVNYRQGLEEGEFLKFYKNGNPGSKGVKKDGKSLGLYFIYDPNDSGRVVNEVYLINWNNDVFQYYVKQFDKSGEWKFEYKPINIELPEEIRVEESEYAEIEFKEASKFDSTLIVVEFSKSRISNRTDLDTIFLVVPKTRYRLTSGETGIHFLRGFIIGNKKFDNPDSIVTYSTYFGFEENVLVK